MPAFGTPRTIASNEEWSSADDGKVHDVAGPVTITLPAGAGAGSGTGYTVAAGGAVTFAAGGGATVQNAAGDLVQGTAWTSCVVRCKGSNVWVVFGTEDDDPFHVSRFGARGDGTTDDTAAIQAALDAAAANVDAAQGEPQAGAVVQLAARMYLISETLVVPDGVALRGAGPRRTVILADSGWVTGTDGLWMINLGPTNHVTSCSLEDLELNGNQVTALVGWYSDSISEHSNIRSVRTIDCLGGAGIVEWTGVGGATGAANHFAVYDCDDILTVAGVTDRRCWSFTGPTGSECTVRLARMTHHSAVGATWANAYGVYCLRMAPEASSMHMESCVVGIWVQSAEGCDIRTAAGLKLPTAPGGTYYTVGLHSSMTGKAVTLANIRRGAGNPADHALFFNGLSHTNDIGLWTSGVSNIESSMWLPASSFTPMLGSPVMASVAGYQPGMLFDPSASEAAGASCEIPDHWTQCSVTAVWSATGAGSGNVVWGTEMDGRKAGDTVDASTTDATAIGAATGNDVIVETVIDTDVPVLAGEHMGVGLYRLATAGTDTYAADAALLGVRLTRTA